MLVVVKFPIFGTVMVGKIEKRFRIVNELTKTTRL